MARGLLADDYLGKDEQLL